MRSKPTKIINTEDFINQAPIKTQTSIIKEDLHKYVQNTKERWPFLDEEYCTLLEGSVKYIRTLGVSIPENEYLTIERHIESLNLPEKESHIKSLKVSKREWIRRAILTTIKREQEYCRVKALWTEDMQK